MVESLKELNRICQKPDYKTKGNWMVRHLVRDLALPVTWLLLHTSFSANGVTLLGMVVILFSAIFFVFPLAPTFLIGALLFQFWYLLDHVDGQIARYRKTSSLTGVYFDYLSHYFTNSVIFFGLGLHAYFVTHQFVMLLLAFIGSFSYALLQSFFDCKYRAYHAGFSAWRGKTIQLAEEKPVSVHEKPHAGLRSFFSLLYKLCEIHVFMNLVSLAAVFNLKIKTLSLAIFIFYALLLPFVAALRIFYTVKTKAIDTSFQKEFQVRES